MSSCCWVIPTSVFPKRNRQSCLLFVVWILIECRINLDLGCSKYFCELKAILRKFVGNRGRRGAYMVLCVALYRNIAMVEITNFAENLLRITQYTEFQYFNCLRGGGGYFNNEWICIIGTIQVQRRQ